MAQTAQAFFSLVILAVQDSSIGDLVTHSLIESVSESVTHLLISASSEGLLRDS